MKESSPLAVREWCISHFLARVALFAFLTHNPAFRAVDDAVKALFRVLNQSHDLCNLWDEKMMAKYGTTRAPTLGAEQRWLGCHRYYGQLARYWLAFKESFQDYTSNSGSTYKSLWEKVEGLR